MIHIATVESMSDKESDTMTWECPVCFKKSENYPSYICIGYCKNPKCKFVMDEGCFMGTICKARRNLLKLTRPEMAKIIGKSKHTIKKYEWDKCSNEYNDFTKELIFNKYKDEKNS